MIEKKIGVISDTHGLLREEARRELQGSDLIIHAGDAGRKEVLDELGKIAKLVVVKGNIDKGEWASDIPATELVEFYGMRIYVIHDLKNININLAEAGVDIVISGHSHKPNEKRENGIIYINPGSAGPKRFNLPISLTILKKKGDRISIENKEIKI
ncbi:MAG: metallophosphoesterase family protein [Bacillota bacterium]